MLLGNIFYWTDGESCNVRCILSCNIKHCKGLIANVTKGAAGDICYITRNSIFVCVWLQHGCADCCRNMSGCVSVKSGVMRKNGCLKGATLAFCTWVCDFGRVWRTEVPSGVQGRSRALPDGGVGGLQAEKNMANCTRLKSISRVTCGVKASI